MFSPRPNKYFPFPLCIRPSLLPAKISHTQQHTNNFSLVNILHLLSTCNRLVPFFAVTKIQASSYHPECNAAAERNIGPIVGAYVTQILQSRSN